MFDKNLIVRQAGTSVVRVLPELTSQNCRIDSVLEIIRPSGISFNFRSILSFINTVFVLRTRASKTKKGSNESDRAEHTRMRLKGQMLHCAESDLIVFLCSPSVVNLDDLNRRGLYLSDIPLHDATRDLVLLSEQFEAEYKLTKNLEILTDKLQQTYKDLEDEKKKSDR